MVSSLKPSQIIGEAKRLLAEGGFREATRKSNGKNEHQEAPLVHEAPLSEVFLFEDERRIVGLILYASWSQLEENWDRAQAEMVARISEHLRRSDPKSWDGYLVLLTRDEPASLAAVARVRHDTRRLRKLVATGRELTTLSAIEDTLLPLLPFTKFKFETKRETLVDRLPEMLEAKGVAPPLAAAAQTSIRENRSPMDGIWSWRRTQ